MDISPNLQSIIDDLVDSGRTEVSLDELAELVIGDPAIGQGELEVLIDALEHRGIEVVSTEVTPAQKVMATVFTAAHALRESLGRAPSIDEIASHTGLQREAVQGAITHARRISRVQDEA